MNACVAPPVTTGGRAPAAGRTPQAPAAHLHSMRQLPVRIAVLGFALLISAAPAHAQGRPTPDQARTLLQTRPDLVAQLRDRLRSSGLTPDQVRARLRAEGYPEDLLDPYLAGGDTTAGATPDSATFSAIRALGLADSVELDSLRGQPLDSLEARSREVVCDTVPIDTAGKSAGGAARADTAMLDSAAQLDG